jgi:DNA repair exonuclease SbcCD nuclease subunit
MLFKFLHAADIHLDSPMACLERYPGVPVEDARLATRRALTNLVDLAVEEKVAFVLIAGDLYDGEWKDFNTGLQFGQEMTRLKEAGIPVLIVAGNHDAKSKVQRRLQMPSNVKWFSTSKPETHRLEDLGVAVHGQGFASDDLKDNLAAGYPEPVPGLFNVGLLHTALDGRHGHDLYAPCSVEDLRARRYDYWALGHVHTHMVVCRDPWVVFSGNTQGRSVRETGPKGCALVTVKDENVEAVEERTLDVLRWVVCEVDVSGCARADDVVERAAAAIDVERHAAQDRMLAARLVMRGATQAHGELERDAERWIGEVRQLVNERSNGGAWVEKVAMKTSPVFDLAAARLRDDPMGGLIRSVERLERGEQGIEALTAEDGDLREDLEDLNRVLSAAGAADLVDLRDPELLLDVKHLLVSRLATGGGT